MEEDIKSVEWIKGYLAGIAAVNSSYSGDAEAEFLLEAIESKDSPHATIAYLNRDWDGKYLAEIEYEVRLLQGREKELSEEVDAEMKGYQHDMLSAIRIDLGMQQRKLEKCVNASYKHQYLSENLLTYLKPHIEQHSQIYKFHLEKFEPKEDTPSYFSFHKVGKEYLIYGPTRSFYLGFLFWD